MLERKKKGESTHHYHQRCVFEIKQITHTEGRRRRLEIIARIKTEEETAHTHGESLCKQPSSSCVYGKLEARVVMITMEYQQMKR